MNEQFDYLAHFKRGDKLHIGSKLTLRITHICQREVHVRLCGPLGLPLMKEKAKPRKSVVEPSNPRYPAGNEPPENR